LRALFHDHRSRRDATRGAVNISAFHGRRCLSIGAKSISAAFENAEAAERSRQVLVAEIPEETSDAVIIPRFERLFNRFQEKLAHPPIPNRSLTALKLAPSLPLRARARALTLARKSGTRKCRSSINNELWKTLSRAHGRIIYGVAFVSV